MPWRFDGRRLTVFLLLVSVFLATSVLGWVSLPQAVRAWINVNQYRALVAQRERLGERYNLQVQSLLALQPRISVGLESVTRLRQLLDLEVDGRVAADRVADTVIPSMSIYSDVAQTQVQAERVARVTLDQWLRELQVVEAALHTDPDRLRFLPTILPLDSPRMALSSDFGRHRDPLTETTRFHNGMLLAAPDAARLVAPADGAVTFTGVFRSSRDTWQRLGRMVVLRHGDDFITILGHCGKVYVSPGEVVARGDLVGEVGDSGMAPHTGVYYEVRRHDPEASTSTEPDPAAEWVPVDPKFYILDRSWGDDSTVRSTDGPLTAADYERLPYGLRR